jgi:hypothetical protein
MPPQDVLLRCSSASSPQRNVQPRSRLECQPIKLAIISEGVLTTWPLYVAQAKRLIVWEAEGFPLPPARPGKYLDESYLRAARS